MFLMAFQQRKKELVIRYLKESWNNKDSYFYEPENADVKAAVDGTIESKNSVVLDEADRLGKYNAQWLSQGKYVDPEQSEEYTKIVERHEYVKKRMDKLRSLPENRHRRWNDRKNTSAIVKWQNDEWMVKGSWIWVMAVTVPKRVSISCSFSLVRPSASSVWLTTPSVCSSTTQAVVRTRSDVHSGSSSTIISSDDSVRPAVCNR